MKTIRWMMALMMMLATAGCGTFGGGDGGSSKRAHAGNFLYIGVKGWTSTHVLMSPAITDDQRRDIIATTKAAGYSTIYVYAFNEGDYGRKSVAYSPAQKDHWRNWLGQCNEAGLDVWIWFFADDSGGLHRKFNTDPAWCSARFSEVCNDLGKYVKGYVLGLEVNEWCGSVGTSNDRLARLKACAKGKPVGVHTTGPSAAAYADQADVFFVQHGFNQQPATIKAQIASLDKRWGGKKKIVSCEYALNGTTPQAMALGKAAVEAGAEGVGNGCPRDSIKNLPRW